MATFVMPLMALAPDYASYTTTDGVETMAIKLKGGASRYRKDVLNSTTTVDCQCTLTAGQYEYWRAFYRTATVSGSIPFNCPLTLDRADVQTFKCYFVPNSTNVSNMDGNAIFVVQAQLEVVPIPANPASDAAIISFNGNLQPMEDLLNTITNILIPQIPF
jgi:hypothetical protein